MKKIILMMAISLTSAVPYTFAADSPAPTAAVQAQAFKAHVLNRAELDALIAQPDKVLFIDVRRPDEITSIGGFPVYLSIQSNDLEKKLAFIPKDRRIVLLSNHAGRAGKSADLLSTKGFDVAGAAGVQNYEAEGGTLTKIIPPAAKQALNTAIKTQ
ncbi:rhodanese-like domain-containing protein [Undibacterium sp. SXout7W]|uniref:rhodanese-like domain-containing protein n=1 Tax=Undibacterium sp. SXout7W TaxID=3413049 RepID=UPI003BEF8BB2